MLLGMSILLGLSVLIVLANMFLSKKAADSEGGIQSLDPNFWRKPIWYSL